jgi:immune inhibitor A
MKHKVVAVLSVVALLTGLLVAALPVGASPPPPDYRPVDVGPEIRGWEATPDRIAPMPEGLEEAEAAAEAAAAASTTDCILDAKTWMSADFYSGYYFFDVFYLMAVGTQSELWVQADLSWPAGDPRPTPVVTCEQAAYLVGEFDNNIYPIETDFFGPPDPHDGTYSLLEAWGYFPPGYYFDEDGKQVVLVSNIEDDNYYDPTYPIYTAGFYSPSFEGYFDRNVMSIDAYDWENRVGPDGSRPYLYEGIFAHEYQHLLHDDYDPDEENFVNEGMSDFAMVLTGYGASVIGHLEDTADYPENSLVVWGDQGDLEILADYGMAFLFQYYLLEQFGKPFIQAEFHNPDNGITGVNTTLESFNIQKDFAELFHDWSVALLLDSKTPGGGRYQFKDLDFQVNIGTPGAPNPEAYDTPGAPPWGTDYIWLTGDPKSLGKFTFNGVDYTIFPTPWTSDGEVLWSGAGDLLDNWAIFEATGGGALTFDTYWDIEDYWDFGFVQVSTDGGHSWTSLENDYTTYDYDPNAISTVVENLPGLTSWSCFVEADCWVNMSFDLSAYAGQDILIAFRYVTDWATAYEGWYIDNVYVDGTLISDGSDAGIFKDITEIFPVNNDFTVTFVGIKEKQKGNEYKVLTMKLDDVTEEGLFELNKILKWASKAVMLVTFDAPEGFTGYADYTYDFTYTNQGPKK